MINETIQQLVTDALTALSLEGSVVLEHPNDTTHGDYSCNVAMVLAKAAGSNPRELAEKIVASLAEHEYIARVEVAGPGFINFFLSETFFAEQTAYVRKLQHEWGEGDAYSGTRMMVEYTDPNPFKELHIGHLVPNALGESLARLYESQGAQVRRVTFQGDVGMHVAKAIWGLQKNGFVGTSSIAASDLGKAYATGAAAFESDEATAAEIQALNKVIYERSDEAINELYDNGKAVSIAYFEEAYKVLGSAFDHYFFESVTGPIGKAAVEEHIGEVFEKSDGAVIFKGEEYGLHTRVFINKEGIPTYEAKDIGLMIAKKEWWPFDTSVTVTGTEQASYFEVVAKAASLMMPETKDTIKLVPNGMLKLTEGKMSSRTGDVISARSFIEQLSTTAQERMEHKNDATAVAVSAIKYAILRTSAGKDIMFDPKNSLSLEGDTGPYLQYAYARTRSILRKATGVNITENRGGFAVGEVEKLLYRFPEVVERAATENEPHHVAGFLAELASAYNSWYAREQVLDGSLEEGYKLALTDAVGITLKNGLNLLGIEALERM